jgi:hypothetical protein
VRLAARAILFPFVKRLVMMGRINGIVKRAHDKGKPGQRSDQGNRVKERMLNPIEQFFATAGLWDSHRAKL